MIFNSLECLQRRPLDREVIGSHSVITSLIATHHQTWDGFDDPLHISLDCPSSDWRPQGRLRDNDEARPLHPVTLDPNPRDRWGNSADEYHYWHGARFGVLIDRHLLRAVFSDGIKALRIGVLPHQN